MEINLALMIGIYCITNLVNSKKYIGQSVDIKNRWRDHIKETNKGSNKSILYSAIRKYGLDNFSFEIIEECKVEELDEKEEYWISFYQTYPPELGKGYNMNPGGKNKGLCKVYLNLDDIIYDLKYTKLSQVKIAEKYNTTNSTIYDINQGNEYYKDDISYPIRKINPKGYLQLNLEDVKEIQQLLIDSYIPKCEIALKFNVSVTTIDNIDKGKTFFNINLNYPLRKKKDGVSYHIGKPKIPTPSYEELFTSFYELRSKELVAQKYNVSTMLIKKWCKHYSINAQNKKNYIEKYEVEFLGREPKNKIKIQTQIYQIDPNTDKIVNIFNSKADAAEYLGLRRRIIDSITRAIKNKTLYKGYYWKEEIKVLNKD